MSLGPSAAAGQDLLRIDSSTIVEGQLQSIDSGFEGNLGYRYLIARKNGKFHVLGIGTRDEKYILPWGNLYNLGAYCIKMDLLDEQIICSDNRIYDFHFHYEKEQHAAIWKYDLQGNNVASEKLSGLDVVPFFHEGSEIVIGRR